MGDLVWRMGEWPACGDLPKRMGRCVRRVVVWGNRDTVWGGGLCVGRPRNRMGNESRMKNRNMEAGGGGSAWGSPNRMGSLSQWQTWRDLRTLHIFATTGSAARAWAPPDRTAPPPGWRQVAGALVPLGSVGVWQWRSFKVGTGPHGSGAATAPLQPAPDAAAAPLKGWPCRTGGLYTIVHKI